MTGLLPSTAATRALAAVAADLRAAVDPDTPAGGGGADPDAGAAAALLDHLGVPLVADAAGSARERLARHGVRTRPVRLEPGWHRHGGPALLAADGPDVVAVLPRRGGYVVVDPSTGTARRVGTDLVGRLSGTAHAVYRPLPPGGHDRRSLARFALGGAHRDIAGFLGAGLAFGLLSLLVPMSVGTLVPTLLGGGGGQLWWIGLLIATATATAGLVLYVRNALTIRLQSRIQAELEPAIWGRLLEHEIGFFRQYTTGEIVQRGNAIAQIRGAVSEVVVGAVLGVVFSLTGLVVVVVVTPVVGCTLVAVLAAVCGALALLTRRQERHESVVQDSFGEVYGTLYALLLGIDKIQAAGREIQALARWAAIFRRQKQADAAALREQARASALVAAVQPLLIATVLGAVALLGPSLSVADLVVASVCAGQVAMAMGQLNQVATTAYAVGPALRRLAPILAEPVRVCGTRDPGTLRGAVTLDEVGFTHPGAAAPTLDRVSLHAEPGEMVAVVGPSGAGKSTIVRLLLGFEQPSRGEIRYDEHRLADLDLRATRRRLGTVLQHGTLLRGTVFDNVVGADADLDPEDVWHAAELAGVADDLRSLPMGLQTRVGETGAGFSGGQIQRLLLARALVRRPAVLLLDEATSALDNRTQHEVSERIAALACTRIVVAHRLSTVRVADRIVVLDRGRVRATGTYPELIAHSDLFRRLVGGDSRGDLR